MAVSLLFVVDFTWRYEFNYEKEIESRFIFGQFLTRIIRKKNESEKESVKKIVGIYKMPPRPMEERDYWHIKIYLHRIRSNKENEMDSEIAVIQTN